MVHPATGGFGRVYRAHVNGVESSLKFAKAADVERQGMEVAQAANRHPSVLQLYDIWEVNDHLVTRWELADSTLYDILLEWQDRGHAGIPWDEVLPWMKDVASGVDFLNRDRGSIHRDIKPQNLFVVMGKCKIGDVDVGIAKYRS